MTPLPSVSATLSRCPTARLTGSSRCALNAAAEALCFTPPFSRPMISTCAVFLSPLSLLSCPRALSGPCTRPNCPPLPQVNCALLKLMLERCPKSLLRDCDFTGPLGALPMPRSIPTRHNHPYRPIPSGIRHRVRRVRRVCRVCRVRRVRCPCPQTRSCPRSWRRKTRPGPSSACGCTAPCLSHPRSCRPRRGADLLGSVIARIH